MATKHGCKRKGECSPEYRVWMKMRSRCNNPNVPAYPRYGGRGVRVCPQWDDFSVFLADMGGKPSRWHSIDRIDNEKGYEPGNCRWATMKQQQRNRSSNRLVFYDGLTATVSEHCERIGLKATTVHMRLKKGAPMDMAFSKERPKYGSLIALMRK